VIGAGDADLVLPELRDRDVGELLAWSIGASVMVMPRTA